MQHSEFQWHVQRAGANCYGIPLYEYLGGINASIMPVPDDEHFKTAGYANNNIEFQEFIVAPVGAKSFQNAIQIGAGFFIHLKKS